MSSTKQLLTELDQESVTLRYALTCQRVARDYIVRSTRFELGDIHFRYANPQFCDFTVRVTHTLEVVTNTSDYKGQVTANQGDFQSGDWNAFSQAVAAQEAAEWSNPETRLAVLAMIKKNGYATYPDRCHVRLHPRRLLHPYRCSNCAGHGQLDCNHCHGSGQVTCHECHGHGDTHCWHCHGRGFFETTEIQATPNGVAHYPKIVRCAHCFNGRIRCRTCNGNRQLTCQACHGSGAQRCHTCDGHGLLTRVAQTQTFVVPKYSGLYPKGLPSYLHDAASKLGFVNLHQHADLTLSRESIGTDQAVVEVDYRCVLPVCDMEIEVAGHRRPFVLAGKQQSIHDAGGILEKVVEGDFIELLELLRSPRRRRPGFYRVARPALRNFFQSEVHQNMVAFSAQGQTVNTIVESIHRSVSADYVQQSLAALSAICATINGWSLVKYAAAVAIITPLLMVLVQLYFWGDGRFQLFPFSGPDYVNIGLVASACTGTAFLFSRWSFGHWASTTGGKPLSAWIKAKGLRIGLIAMLTATGLLTYGCGQLFQKYPLRVDSQGKLFGAVPVSWVFPRAIFMERLAPVKRTPTK